MGPRKTKKHHRAVTWVTWVTWSGRMVGWSTSPRQKYDRGGGGMAAVRPVRQWGGRCGRGQIAGPDRGTGRTGTGDGGPGSRYGNSMEATAVSGTSEIWWFLGDRMLGSGGFLRVFWATLTPSNSFKHETQGFEISFGSRTEIGLIVV